MDNATAGLLGGVIGGAIGIWLLAAIWEWALFKRVLNDPVSGKVSSAAFAYVTGSALYSMNDSVSFAHPLLMYLPGALLVGFAGWRRGTKLRAMQPGDRVLEDTFR